jgi:hypothetical protein
MFSSIHPSHWDWTAIAALSTVALAIGTFWMAWGTRRLGKQALAESVNAHRLAVAAEEQRDIASRNEYSASQPILIPIIPRRDTDDRTAQYIVGNTVIDKLVEASFLAITPTNRVTVRIVLRNVGQGVGRILQEPNGVLVEADIGSGFKANGISDPVVVAPGDTVEIWAIGTPTMSPSPVPEWIVRGNHPYVRVQFQYTDLANAMVTDCDILFQPVHEDELRPIDIVNSDPRPFTPNLDGS